MLSFINDEDDDVMEAFMNKLCQDDALLERLRTALFPENKNCPCCTRITDVPNINTLEVLPMLESTPTGNIQDIPDNIHQSSSSVQQATNFNSINTGSDDIKTPACNVVVQDVDDDEHRDDVIEPVIEHTTRPIVATSDDISNLSLTLTPLIPPPLPLLQSDVHFQEFHQQWNQFQTEWNNFVRSVNQRRGTMHRFQNDPTATSEINDEADDIVIPTMECQDTVNQHEDTMTTDISSVQSEVRNDTETLHRDASSSYISETNTSYVEQLIALVHQKIQMLNEDSQVVSHHQNMECFLPTEQICWNNLTVMETYLTSIGSVHDETLFLTLKESIETMWNLCYPRLQRQDPQPLLPNVVPPSWATTDTMTIPNDIKNYGDDDDDILLDVDVLTPNSAAYVVRNVKLTDTLAIVKTKLCEQEGLLDHNYRLACQSRGYLLPHIRSKIFGGKHEIIVNDCIEIDGVDLVLLHS